MGISKWGPAASLGSSCELLSHASLFLATCCLLSLFLWQDKLHSSKFLPRFCVLGNTVQDGRLWRMQESALRQQLRNTCWRLMEKKIEIYFLLFKVKGIRRKAITNLDSILKSRDITLLTKVNIVKAIVFPVVMYGCESWTIKKAECRRIDAFKLWCWRRLLRVPWTARRSNQSILKEISPEYSLEGVMLKFNTLATWCEELTDWKRPWFWERLKAGG